MNLEDFQQHLGYVFKDVELLREALTHKSVKKIAHNERLEFLGDAVLDLIIGEFLYKSFPNAPEGDLSKMRASMVNEKAFAILAKHLRIGDYLYISRAEEQNNGRQKDSILSNALEALIGAIYLENGLEEARSLVLNLLNNVYSNLDFKDIFFDHKTELQELTQALFNVIPEYIVLDSWGPDHDKEFLIGIFIDGREYAKAKGRSKKEGQQKCAKIALESLRRKS
ncbi:MAG: ribonuclease III [Helicobacter sp.]|nr:ribonuclease III [Helicobacter sp.]